MLIGQAAQQKAATAAGRVINKNSRRGDRRTWQKPLRGKKACNLIAKEVDSMALATMLPSRPGDHVAVDRTLAFLSEIGCLHGLSGPDGLSGRPFQHGRT